MSHSNDDDPTRLLADLDFVRAVARQLCRDDADADDLAQDTMVRALDRPPEHGRSRRGWLTTVTRNLFKNRVRDDARRRERERGRDHGDLEVPSAEEVVALEQQRRLVVEAVLALPDRYREVVLLRHFRGVDVATSAHRLGLSETAVRTRLSRANQLLKSYLDRRHGGDRARWVTALLPLTVPTPRDAVAVTAATTGGGKLPVMLLAGALVLGLGVASWVAAPPGAPSAPDSSRPAATASARTDAGGSAESPPPIAPTPTPSQRVAAPPEERRDPRLRDLFGVVETRDDEPVADVAVQVTAQIGEYPGPRGHVDLDVVRSGADGRFTVSLRPLERLSSAAISQLFLTAQTVSAEHVSERVIVNLADARDDPPDEPAFRIRLGQDPSIVGRVLTAEGREVGDAIVMFHGDATDDGTTTLSDGRFAHEVSYGVEVGRVITVHAVHPAFGVSDLQHVRVVGDRHTLVPDLLLHPAPTRVEGRVAWPDGRGAAGVEVRYEPSPAPNDAPSSPKAADDLRLVAQRVTAAELWQLPTIHTDRDGRFTIACLSPGRYSFEFGSGEPFEFDVPENVATRIEHVLREPDATQLLVDVVDDQGLSLSDIWVGLHVFRGPRASAAAARFAAEGPVADLLATADEFDQTHYVDDRLFYVPRGAFVVAEAACHDRGPRYAACHIAPTQARADLKIALPPRVGTGVLEVDVRTPAGDPVPRSWVRLCRGRAGHALPILMPDRPQHGGPYSGILGAWYELPSDGLLRDVPPGELTLHVLPGPEADGYRATAAAWPVEERFVRLAERGHQKVDVTTRPGCRIELEVIAHDAEAKPLEVRATITPTGSRSRRERFVTVDGGTRLGEFVDGRLRVCSVASFLPGEYRLEVRTNARLYDAAITTDKVLWERTVSLPLDEPVQVRLSRR